MDIVKKNLLSIIFAVVAVAAIVLAFFPLGGFYEAVQTSLNADKDRYTRAAALLKKPRVMPITEPGQSANPLPAFPTLKLIDWVINKQSGLKDEASDILRKAVVENMREFMIDGRTLDVPDLHKFNPDPLTVQKAMVLTPGALPEPDPNATFNFQKDLDKELKKLRETVLHVGVPPTQADIVKAETELRTKMDEQLQIPVPGQPAINQAAVDADYEVQKKFIPDRLRYQAAKKCRMYIEPTVLQMDPAIKTGTLNKEQIWYAHVGLWIQEDVVRALKATNERGISQPGAASTPPTSVMDSPIKRLARLDIPQGSSIYQRSTPTPTAAGAGIVSTATGTPGETIAGANEVPKSSPSSSPSGRSCNNVYDVVQFNLVVDIDARAMQIFLNQLSRGRLVAVRKMDVARPDLTTATTLGYIYGAAPVVQLNLDCEALMLRDWTVPLMPSGGTTPRPSIREMFQIPTPYVSLLAPPPVEPKP